MRLPPARPVVLGLLAALALAGSASAAENATFRFSLAGIPVGSMSLSSRLDGDHYDAAARLDTTALVNVFAEFFFDGKATGTLRSDGKVVPGRYKATSKSMRALRHTDIAWKNGVPVSVSVNPPRSSAPDPSEQGGALDPVSAGFRLFREAPPDEVCDTTVFVFDGSRRSRLVLQPPVRNGRELTCAGMFARVEGEAASMADLREFPFSIAFRVNEQGVAQLTRIEAPTNFGKAVIARSD
jgi:hypothetical protein